MVLLFMNLRVYKHENFDHNSSQAITETERPTVTVRIIKSSLISIF